MSDVQKQMRPFLTEASATDLEFRTELMFDSFMRGWTYKVWEIALRPGDAPSDEGDWRLIEKWIDSNEAGDYVGIGDLFDPRYFRSLEAILENIRIEVESYI